MFGFQWRPVNDPKYGQAAVLGYLQLSEARTVVGCGQLDDPGGASTSDSMLHFQMRYYIP